MPLLQGPEPPAGYRTGTLSVEPDHLPTRITVLSYDASHVLERTVVEAGELPAILREPRTHWVHLQGLGDTSTLYELGGVFNLDGPGLELIMESHQRPKAEWSGERALAVLRAPFVTPDQTVELDQIGLVAGSNYVLSVQETHSALLQPVWDRYVNGYAGVRESGAAGLLYSIVDQLTDSFYPALEEIGNRLEDLEDRVMETSGAGILEEVNQVRAVLVRLRRVVWPQREAIQRLARNELKVLPQEFEAPLRDTYEHCLQASEVIESYRELVGAINGTYLSAVSNRTNEVMRVLTIMASVFIPLTFIAGIYGMNFENMPELRTRYGYPVVWAAMITVAAAMLLFFHRKGWIWPKDKSGS